MDYFVDMTITGSITAIIILIIKRMFKNKLTPKWHFYIWSILLIRLLIPILPESDLSLFTNVPSTDEVVIRESTGESTEQVKIYYQNIGIGEDNRYIMVNQNVLNIIKKLWWIGVALLTSYFILVYAAFHMKVKQMERCKDDRIIHIFNDCRYTMGIRRTIKVLTGYHTPMLTGLIKPKIIIPDGYQPEEIRQIFLHELCHVKYGDIFFNLLSTVLLCLQWFNPIMWICTFVIRRDMELLCDQRVLGLTNNRKLYASVLLKTALKKNKFILCTTSIQNGEKEIKKRIKFIASNRKTKLIYSISALILVGAVGIMCLTNGKESSAATDYHINGGDNAATESEIGENTTNENDDNLIYVIRKKYAPGGHEKGAYYEVNYYDITEEDVNLASENELLEYIEYEKLSRNKPVKESNAELQDGPQYIYEKEVKKNNQDKRYVVYSKKREDGTLVKEIILP